MNVNSKAIGEGNGRFGLNMEMETTEIAIAYDNLRIVRDLVKRQEDEIKLLRGAIRAQDEREREAGIRCGVAYELHGCEWPDAVAEEVLVLQVKLRDLEEKTGT